MVLVQLRRDSDLGRKYDLDRLGLIEAKVISVAHCASVRFRMIQSSLQG